jgi:KUP system potassium uptake protein
MCRSPRQRLRRAVHFLLDADGHRLAQVRGAGAARRQPRRRRAGRHAGAGFAGGQRQAQVALRKWLLGIGIFGTSLFYGDGVITPAISVLSAVEGLEVVSPAFKQYVIPLTLVILFCLFAVQKRGTAGIGKFFGPITLVWFITIAVLGVSHIVRHPEILWAISPHHALGFMWTQPGTTFIILGAVVLCVTGGRGAVCRHGPLRQAADPPGLVPWSCPALTLNYFGQGALLLQNPEAVKNPFFLMAPDWALVPLVGWPPWPR